MISEDPAHTPRAYRPLFLNCPRCGLSIRQRHSWLAIEHCPRCLARSRIPVTLFASPLPVGELYGDGSAPAATPTPPPPYAPV
jgi:hypothetical protein